MNAYNEVTVAAKASRAKVEPALRATLEQCMPPFAPPVRTGLTQCLLYAQEFCSGAYIMRPLCTVSHCVHSDLSRALSCASTSAFVDRRGAGAGAAHLASLCQWRRHRSATAAHDAPRRRTRGRVAHDTEVRGQSASLVHSTSGEG